MDIVLIPGFWLDGASWDEVAAPLREAGHAIPHPVGVTSNRQVLSDDRRYDVPVTVIACEFPAEALRGWMAEGQPLVAELAKVRQVEFVDLPTGHWPQLTRPRELASSPPCDRAVTGRRGGCRPRHARVAERWRAAWRATRARLPQARQHQRWRACSGG